MQYLYIAKVSDKAVQFVTQHGAQWVPKSMILDIDKTKKRVTISKQFKRNVLCNS